MGDSRKREKMVLTQADEVNVPQDHQFICGGLVELLTEDRGRIVAVSGCHLAKGFHPTERSFLQIASDIEAKEPKGFRNANRSSPFGLCFLEDWREPLV